MPAGCELPGCPAHAKPAACSFAAPEPAGASPVAGSQAMLMVALLEKRADGNPQPFHATLEIGENSPKLGARNEVPHEPRIVRPRSSEISQLKATFGLLVPPTSLYWSCRHEPSSSSLRMPGSALFSPMMGTFNCANPAQT